ncbi:uncharacterized protein LOC135148436 [Daucus carota subsp. sativus]|uniref:uncharacterized protein LOC135148436 n=1 Tax=Daucus carota subsp. sativus TaxID=79200 RepID=UPI003083C59B
MGKIDGGIDGCQGTKAIKKNRRTILTQEYEHFESKAGESLTDLYDRFVKLLNDLSLVDKEYDLEDSNLKFLLALPEKWDLKVTTIRDNHDLEEMSLDDIFGRLKTYELKMEQRSKRHGGKPKPVALKVQGETAMKNKGKTHITKFDTESSNSDDDSDSDVLSDSEDSDTEMMQLASLMGHFATECKKAKNEKGQAFISKKGSWADSSDSEEEVNYALMANTDNSSEAVQSKLPHSTLAFDTEDITELRLFLKNLHMLEVQTERDVSVFIKNELLKKNASLQSELAREREIIRTWTNSGKTTQNILESGNWKKGLGYTDKNEAESVKQETAKIDRPKVAPVRFVAESRVHEKPKTDKSKQVNIGLMTQKQLKHELKEVKQENRIKEPKKNRNGKEELGHKFYVSKSEVKTRNVRFRPENPCFHCGSLCKDETSPLLVEHVKQLDKISMDAVKIIRSDNGTEFKNSKMEEFCKANGIKQEFSAPGTPQQNGVVERKNKTLIEAARTMLEEAKLPTYFWVEAVETACFTQNATLINKHGKTPFEMSMSLQIINLKHMLRGSTLTMNIWTKMMRT